MADFDIDRVPAAARSRTGTKPETHPRPAAQRDDRRSDAVRLPVDMNPAAVLRLQQTVGNTGVVQRLRAGEPPGEDAPSRILDVVGKGGGVPLPDDTRQGMEARLGQSFADVRVHTSERAAASARSVGANAYTVGSEIVFAEDKFDPASARGQAALAHELAHVVQQRAGPVEGSDVGGGVRLSHPTDRFERAADEAASRAAAGRTLTSITANSAVAQRQTEADEEIRAELPTPVQRPAEPTREPADEAEAELSQSSGN